MLGIELAAGLGKFDSGILDLNEGKKLLKEASELVDRGIAEIEPGLF